MTTLQGGNEPSEMELIREVIAEQHPATVRELADLLQDMGRFDETSYLNAIKTMMMDGSIRLGKPTYEIHSMLDYFITPIFSGWFWITISLVAVASLTVYMIPETYPLNILRFVFGSALIVLPGCATIKLLFPQSELLSYEQLALSVAISLAIVPIIGFVLNLTPSGIRLLPITLSLSAYTIFAATAAAWRSHLAIAQL